MITYESEKETVKTPPALDTGGVDEKALAEYAECLPEVVKHKFFVLSPHTIQYYGVTARVQQTGLVTYLVQTEPFGCVSLSFFVDIVNRLYKP